VRAVAEEHGIDFSPWHPGKVPSGEEGIPFHAVIGPIAVKHDATPQQIALAWQLHRTPSALPIPGTTSVQHLRENLAGARIQLTHEEVSFDEGDLAHTLFVTGRAPADQRMDWRRSGSSFTARHSFRLI
jgi:aryl-alcohol dehydrogenase-like predicted oxidoreductase